MDITNKMKKTEMSPSKKRAKKVQTKPNKLEKMKQKQNAEYEKV